MSRHSHRSALVPVLLAGLLAACSATPATSPPSGPASIGRSPVASVGAGSTDAAAGASGAASQVRSADAGDCADVAAALRTRVRALATGDARLWSSAFTAADPRAATRDAALLPILRQLRVSLSIGPIRPRASPVDRPGTSVCVADLGYAITGTDRAPRVVTTTVTTQRLSGGRVVMTDLSADSQPWDLPNVQVWRDPQHDPQGAGIVVIGNVPQPELQRAGREARAARTAVGALWGSAPGLVVVLPRTPAELAAQLRRAASSLPATAAVTDGPLRLGEKSWSDRIYLNLAALGPLTERGRQSVVTHEVMHAAIRATTTRPVPMWLSEGFAQWAGYHDVGATSAETAPTLWAAVRGGHPPNAWPTDVEFDPQGTTAKTDLLGAYERAWSVVAYLTERSGQPAVVRFYRACATRESDCESMMPSFFGAPRSVLVEGWKAWLISSGRHA